MQLFRSYLFMAGAALTIFILFFFLLASQVSNTMRQQSQRIWAKTVLIWLKITCNLDHKVIGLENIPKDNAPFIILARHQSAWETIGLQVIFEQPITWIAKRSFIFVPIAGWCYFLTHSITINRSASRKSVEYMKTKGTERLRSGEKIVIFPEGTRVPYGKIGRFKRGGSILSEYSGFPIIPVAHNAGKFWPRKSTLKKAGTITVKIGPLISPENKSNKQINKEVVDWMKQAMKEI